MNYLITGATGNIGSLVVQGLIDVGERPRVLARDPQKALSRFGAHVDIVRGDLGDASTLTEAFQGVERVFLINSGPQLAQRDALAAAAARAAGVAHIVKLSPMDVQQQNIGTGVWHAQGEARLRSMTAESASPSFNLQDS